MLTAVGSSLIAVTGFGMTTAANYAWSGLVSWRLAFVFIAGGAVGGFAGAALAGRLSRTGTLPRVFATLVAASACYMLWKSANQVFSRIFLR